MDIKFDQDRNIIAPKFNTRINIVVKKPAIFNLDSKRSTHKYEEENAEITIVRSGNKKTDASVVVRPLDDNIVDQNDFVVQFDEDELTKTISVPLLKKSGSVKLDLISGGEYSKIGTDDQYQITVLEEEKPIIFALECVNVTKEIATMMITKPPGTKEGSVSFKCEDETALASTHYVSNGREVYFKEGQESETFDIKIIDGHLDGDTEFSVILHTPVGKNTSINPTKDSCKVTIKQKEYGGIFNFDKDYMTVNQSTGYAKLRVERTKGYFGPYTLAIILEGETDQKNVVHGDKASKPTEFSIQAKEVTFDHGQTEAFLEIPIDQTPCTSYTSKIEARFGNFNEENATLGPDNLLNCNITIENDIDGGKFSFVKTNYHVDALGMPVQEFEITSSQEILPGSLRWKLEGGQIGTNFKTNTGLINWPAEKSFTVEFINDIKADDLEITACLYEPSFGARIDNDKNKANIFIDNSEPEFRVQYENAVTQVNQSSGFVDFPVKRSITTAGAMTLLYKLSNGQERSIDFLDGQEIGTMRIPLNDLSDSASEDEINIDLQSKVAGMDLYRGKTFVAPQIKIKNDLGKGRCGFSKSSYTAKQSDEKLTINLDRVRKFGQDCQLRYTIDNKHDLIMNPTGVVNFKKNERDTEIILDLRQYPVPDVKNIDLDIELYNPEECTLLMGKEKAIINLDLDINSGCFGFESIAPIYVKQKDRDIKIVVERTGSDKGEVKLDWRINSTDGSDFIKSFKYKPENFKSGETKSTIVIPIDQRHISADDEDFTVELLDGHDITLNEQKKLVTVKVVYDIRKYR